MYVVYDNSAIARLVVIDLEEYKAAAVYEQPSRVHSFGEEWHGGERAGAGQCVDRGGLGVAGSSGGLVLTVGYSLAPS